MPPVALQALAFSKTKSMQRCVTLWAYLDERDGKILDAGIERTTVSKPTVMTFEYASSAMEVQANDQPTSHHCGRDTITLLALEHVLLKWLNQRQLTSKVTRKRTARLISKEEASRGFVGNGFDGKVIVFKRTRAHCA